MEFERIVMGLRYLDPPESGFRYVAVLTCGHELLADLEAADQFARDRIAPCPLCWGESLHGKTEG